MNDTPKADPTMLLKAAGKRRTPPTDTDSSRGEALVRRLSRAVHEHLSRRDIMQYLDNDEDCEGIARACLAALSIPQSEAGEPICRCSDVARANRIASRMGAQFTPTAQTEEVANGQPGYLTAYVSLDGKTVGIDHETDADWHEVRRAHEVLRDRLNERLGAQDACPIRPAQTEGSGLARDWFERGFISSYAEATVANGCTPPFELTDAIIEKAWSIRDEGREGDDVNGGDWHIVQYGYEKFAIQDERGTEIGFVHRRRDADRILTALRTQEALPSTAAPDTTPSTDHHQV